MQSQTIDQGEAVEGPDKHGYSKNTVKALELIRKELQPSVDEGEGTEMLSFKKMSAKVSTDICACYMRSRLSQILRYPDAQRHRFSLSFSSWAQETASSFRSPSPSPISKSRPRRICGSTNTHARMQLMTFSVPLRSVGITSLCYSNICRRLEGALCIFLIYVFT